MIPLSKASNEFIPLIMAKFTTYYTSKISRYLKPPCKVARDEVQLSQFTSFNSHGGDAGMAQCHDTVTTGSSAVETRDIIYVDSGEVYRGGDSSK